jgi:hypothetical protein
MSETLEQLKNERQALTLAVEEKVEGAVEKLEEVESLIRAAEIDLERRRLAQAARRQREEDQQRQRHEAERVAHERELKRLAKQRLELSRRIEQAVGLLVESCRDYKRVADLMHNEAEALGARGRYYSDPRPVIEFIQGGLWDLWPSDFPRPQSRVRPTVTFGE